MKYYNLYTIKKIFCVIVISFICSFCHAQLPHWQPVDLKTDNQQSQFYVDTEENVLYITGAFHHVNGITANFIKWDGQNYTLLPPSPHYVVGPVTKYQGQLYAAGNRGLARFNGTSWEILDSFITGISGFYHYRNKLVVTGAFKKIAGHSIGSAAQWDGNSWTDFFNLDTLFGSDYWFINNIVEYKGDIYIAGNMNPANQPDISEIARFDGQKWKDVGGGIAGNGLSDITHMILWKDDLYHLDTQPFNI